MIPVDSVPSKHNESLFLFRWIWLKSNLTAIAMETPMIHAIVVMRSPV